MKLTPHEKKILSLIENDPDIINDTKKRAKIAKDNGLSEKTLRNRIGDLKKYGVINSDNNKMKQLEKFNLRRIRIPYYFQLTKDIAKFIFDDLIFHYTGQKYYNDAAHIRSVEQIYRHPKTGEALKDLEKENPFIYSPGLHTSEYVPGSLHNLGLKKNL